MELTTHAWWPRDDLEQLREALAHWLTLNWSRDITLQEWWARLAAAGLAAPTWDRSQGGLSSTTRFQQVVEQELAVVGAIAPPTTDDATRLVGPALRQFATREQAEVLVPELLSGRARWATMVYDTGATRPEDTQCRAQIDWKYVTLSGDKVCSEPLADRALVLTRTGGEGRDGLTWLVVDLDHPTVTLQGDAVHIANMQMLTDRVLGEVGKGWHITKAILPYLERSLSGRVRRGLVHVQPGIRAGNLTRTVGELLDSHRPPPTPAFERRLR